MTPVKHLPGIFGTAFRSCPWEALRGDDRVAIRFEGDKGVFTGDFYKNKKFVHKIQNLKVKNVSSLNLGLLYES